MVSQGARARRVLRHRLSAVALLFSILLLNLASDRFHNHLGAEEALASFSRSSRGESLNRHPPFPESHRPVVCVACLHHRTYGVSSSDGLGEGPTAVLPEVPLAPAPIPPPAPHSRPAGLRAPPSA
ncbi:MAG: hypothetical protein L0191_14260 [Acidobacteria bacterium]|nr:hypothetical protein [Acidobacteriota bacterium]